MAKEIEAQITGNVWRVLVKPGDEVDEEDTLIIFESMKMEIPLESGNAGKIVQVLVKEGQTVTEGDIVVVMEEV